MHRNDQLHHTDLKSPIAAVMERELSAIFAGDAQAQKVAAQETLWGLALSGGGIRSATFALGLLQALARCRAIRGFHYLSSVSGGGYIGAFLQGAIRRFGLNGACALLQAKVHQDEALDTDPPKQQMPRNRPLRHLREYSNYLSPHKSALSGDTLGMIATYLRNVLLIQVQLLALMLACGLAPLWAYPLMERLGANPLASLPLAGALALIASACLAQVSASAQHIHSVPSQRGARAQDPAAKAVQAQTADSEAPRAGVALASNLTVFLLASASAIGALGVFGLGDDSALPSACAALGLDARWPSCARFELGAYTMAVYASVWLVWFVFDRLRGAEHARKSHLQKHRLRFLLGSLAAAALAGALITLLRELAPSLRVDATWSAIIWGTPLVLIAVVATAAIHTGLVGDALSDLQREIWARVGGRSGALVLVGICGSLGLLVIGPWLLGRPLHSDDALWSRLVGLGGIVSWLLVTFGGVAASARVSAADAASAPRLMGLRRALATVAPWIFVLGLWVVIGLLAQSLLVATGAESVPALAPGSVLGDYFDALSRLAVEHHAQVSILMLGAFVLWLLFGLLMDGNELSLNAFYRNRLVRCYLGATNADRRPESITNFDPRDDITLHDLAGDGTKDRPLYPLIGATLNLVSSKQLDWQDRRAASFVLSPHYCGHLPPPGRAGAEAAGDPPELADEHSLAHRLGLGTAVAISGAAVSPNMGARSSPAITFLLTLFDARLGWWLPNRIVQARRWIGLAPLDKPPFPGMQLLAELLGLTHGNGSFVHVSDGGHFENLGIYELVRRRCRFILCSDAGADPKREFADLGNAIQKCRVDFGAKIEIDIAELRPDSVTGRSRRHASLGHITYADGVRGLLLYLKPSLVGDEDADIQHYARLHPEFPHQSTADQFFDEAQFECYRQLGEHIGQQVFASTLERIDDGSSETELGLPNSETKERLLTELAHRFHPSIDLIGRNFSRQGEAMARLYSTLRSTPALAVLDAQFYPGWSLREGPGDGTRAASAASVVATLPQPQHFRDCFYFCQELIQLMESAYIDLNLDSNWEHPDHRGWMNVIRHWSWSPMFRVAWVLSAHTFGSRFVSFCETRAGVPRVVDALAVEGIDIAPNAKLADRAKELHDEGKINLAELGILASDAVIRSGPAQRLYLLKLRWSRFLAVSEDRPADPTLGIALVRDSTLLLFRIQDHVRRLGFGSSFMRLIKDHPIKHVSIKPGDYGPTGTLSVSEQDNLTKQLTNMLNDAWLRRPQVG